MAEGEIQPLDYDPVQAYERVFETVIETEEAWFVFRALYMNSDERTAALRLTAGIVFGVLRHVLADYMLVQLHKLGTWR